MSELDPLNPTGFSEDLGGLVPEKPPLAVQRKKLESRNASRWQVWMPTGHRVQDTMVPVMAADLTDVGYSLVGTPDLEIVPDEALVNQASVVHVGRNRTSGRLTLAIPDSTAKLMERAAHMSSPIAVQRRNYCGAELVQIEHFDQVYFGPVQTDGLTASGPGVRDSVPMVSYSGMYLKRAVMNVGPPEKYIYRIDGTIEYGISDLVYGSDISSNPEPCSTLWLLMERHTGTPQRSYLYRTVNSPYYREGAPNIIGGQFELIHSDAVNNRKWSRMFEHRGRVWLIGTASASYDGITVIDQLIDPITVSKDERITVIGQVVDADLDWHRMAVSGYDSNIMYLNYWYDVTDTINGIGDGVLRSLDHGLTWTKVHGQTFDDAGVDNLYKAICAAGNFVAIGAESGTDATVLFSNDTGDTWTLKKTVFDGIHAMSACLLDDKNPDYAIVYLMGLVGDVVRIVRTDNAFVKEAVVFEKDLSGFGGGGALVDIFASLSGNQIWARATSASGLNHYTFRSEDRGVTWVTTHMPSPPGLDISDLGGLHLTVCRENPDYAAVGY